MRQVWHLPLALGGLIAATMAIIALPAALRPRFGLAASAAATILVGLILGDLGWIAAPLGMATVVGGSAMESPPSRRAPWLLHWCVAAIALWVGIPDTEAPVALVVAGVTLLVVSGGDRQTAPASVVLLAAQAALIWAAIVGDGGRSVALCAGITITLLSVVGAIAVPRDGRAKTLLVSAVVLADLLIARIVVRWELFPGIVAMSGCVLAVSAYAAALVRRSPPVRRRP